MDTLRAMQVFVEVAKQKGFAPAAKVLGLSTSSVSRHVTNLEDQFGTELFTRTTRHLRLTHSGANLLAQCSQVVNDVDQIVRNAKTDPVEPRGQLRVTMPAFLGAMLMEGVVAQFAVEHPNVALDLVLLDRLVNLVEEGFDLAIRTGVLPDSTLISRKFLDMHLALVAAPEYVARHGEPQKPSDLRVHNCIIDTVAPYGDKWPLGRADASRRVHVKGNVRVNSGTAARDLAIGGAGLTLLPDYMVYEDVNAGRLVTLLDQHVVNEGGIYIVYPQTRHPSGALRRFSDLLMENSKPINTYRSAKQRTGVSLAGD